MSLEPCRSLPEWTPNLSGCLLRIAASAGDERSRLLARWASATETEVYRVSADLARGGIWAGLADLLQAVLPDLRATVPEAVTRHGYEISTVLPTLRDELAESQLPLTETVPADEKVRSYPMDRAYRILHGLVDLFAAWRRQKGCEPWIIVCDHFDRVGFLVSRFYRQLMRRLGSETRLTLVLAEEPGGQASPHPPFAAAIPQRSMTLDLEAGEEAPAPEELTRRARELESQVGQDLRELEIHLPQLIDLWSRSSEPEKALPWKAMAFSVYNHYGFYEDALIYGEEVLPHIDRVTAQDKRFNRWQIVGGLYNSYVSCGRVQEAHQVLQQEAMGQLDDPGDRSRALYLMAMLHTRFLPDHDLDTAEALIDQALEELDRSDEPESDRHFFAVFLRNGLALIRHRQGRPEEAIELCRDGFAFLNEHLSPEEHRLHRSVLLYNIGQVYSSMGELPMAIDFYTQVLEMDPYYSEYYNDRGSLYLKAGELEAAARDFEKAIELSPPYHEVHTNLAQALRGLGRLDEAEATFTRSLELVPEQSLALFGRAQVREHLGKTDAARADYAAALELDPEQPLGWASLASLDFEAGNHDASLEALDRAIALAPDLADLYFNRAHLHEARGAHREATADLERYLELAPEAPERGDIEAKLEAMAAA